MYPLAVLTGRRSPRWRVSYLRATCDSGLISALFAYEKCVFVRNSGSSCEQYTARAISRRCWRCEIYLRYRFTRQCASKVRELVFDGMDSIVGSEQQRRGSRSGGRWMMRYRKIALDNICNNGPLQIPPFDQLSLACMRAGSTRRPEEDVQAR